MGASSATKLEAWSEWKSSKKKCSNGCLKQQVAKASFWIDEVLELGYELQVTKNGLRGVLLSTPTARCPEMCWNDKESTGLLSYKIFLGYLKEFTERSAPS